jgi:hypothetical protein
LEKGKVRAKGVVWKQTVAKAAAVCGAGPGLRELGRGLGECAPHSSMEDASPDRGGRNLSCIVALAEKVK